MNSYTSGSRLFATTANTLPFFNIGQRPDLVSGNIRSDISMSDYDPNDPARNTYISRSALLRRNPVNTATRLAHWKCGPMRFDESFAVFKQTKIGERLTNQFRVEIQNPLNRTVLEIRPWTSHRPHLDGSAPPRSGLRNIQLGMKLIF